MEQSLAHADQGGDRLLTLPRLEGERFGYAVAEERLHHDAESRYVTEILRILRERGNTG